MVKKLRRQFVIVTTSLMVVVFGIFLIINTAFNLYWDKIEIMDMLTWISKSGVFTTSSVADKEEIEMILADEDIPIIGEFIKPNGEIIRKQVLGNEDSINVPSECIDKMLLFKNTRDRIGQYYYVYSQMPNEDILLVIMDSDWNEHLIEKIVGLLGLSILGIGLLILITLYLSRFVTEPARQSLLREKRFISDASHELKTPLGAISINAQAIKVDEGENLYINNIISETDRMNRLIEKLLILSKLEETPESLVEDVNISEICEEMVLTYESVAYEKKVNMNYEIADNMVVKGNEDELRQLIAILIDNAIKNTPVDGDIRIKCYEAKKKNIIEVINTGSTIGEEDLPHIFERFYTSDTSRKNNSFGLGLSIAKAIVLRHKGEILANSDGNNKTVFTVLM